jgi:hypothetical protein
MKPIPCRGIDRRFCSRVNQDTLQADFFSQNNLGGPSLSTDRPGTYCCDVVGGLFAGRGL